MQKSKSISTVVLTIFFLIVTLLALFPLISLVFSSFRPASELLRGGISFNVKFNELSLDNYTYLFTEAGQYWKWYGNSLIISALTIVLSLFFSSMVGYSLAVYDFKGRNLLFLIVVFIIMVPFEILMLPLYELVSVLNLIDTYTGIVLPGIISASAVFFFRQYAMGLPKELMDAARMDGCTEYGIYFKVMMPLMLPSFAAMAILQGLFSWNNFVWPLLIIRSGDMFTLPVGLQTLLTPYGSNYDVLISGSIMTIIPIVILFFAFQRFFIAGLTTGGVKG